MYLETKPQKALYIVNYPIEKEKEPAEDGDESDDCSDDEEAEEDDDEVYEKDEDLCIDGNNAPNINYFQCIYQ